MNHHHFSALKAAVILEKNFVHAILALRPCLKIVEIPSYSPPPRVGGKDIIN
ncbi:MAG: hypothetical protein LBR79_04185 [Oscillospiraceae bacterium]|nr:hypothetical protein [Oscillospiraceae bacterium]